jgi:hypothetical protein
MNNRNAHLKLKGMGLATSLALLGPAAAHASGSGSTTQGGWGWQDAAIFGGALLAIVLLGFFGDIAVGSAIVGIGAVFSGGGMFVARTWRAVSAQFAAPTERRGPRDAGRAVRQAANALPHRAPVD